MRKSDKAVGIRGDDMGGAGIMTHPLKRHGVHYIAVLAAHAGQRIDNFLFRQYKQIPKSHLYRVIRSGELRVNSRRVKPSYKLSAGDRIRMPPLAYTPPLPPQLAAADINALAARILYEDDTLLVIDKPPHLAVHRGTAHGYGLIDLLRQRCPADDLGLVHRLDKDTSGCLLVAKSRPTLLALQKHFRDAQVEKIYQALLVGRWARRGRVSMPLRRTPHKQAIAAGAIAGGGRHATTHFRVARLFKHYSLMSVALMTGRTHQIRVHAAHCGHPVAGDNKYGDFANNRALARLGLKRIFLHAHRLAFVWRDKTLAFESPLPDDLQQLLQRLQP